MVERTSSSVRMQADRVIAGLIADRNVLTVIDIEEIYSAFNLSPRPNAGQLPTRIGFKRFMRETGVDVRTEKYKKMVLYRHATDFDPELLIAARARVDHHYEILSAIRYGRKSLLSA